jgi:hypothetical protein
MRFRGAKAADRLFPDVIEESVSWKWSDRL